ncbi:MAG: HAD-IA family hydrolase [Alphaproteobacteria bacterium]|nr:HAD-IA family hydrolase [Alphaproteobacteria bacterium]
MNSISQTVPISAPQAVFFDWDGTLADSFKFLYAAHLHVHNRLSMEPFSLEAFEGYFGGPREKLYTEIYGERREEAKTQFESYVLENHLGGFEAMPGTHDLIDILRRKGIPAGVVSNKKANLITAEIRHMGWDDVFSAIVGAGEAKEDKPSPAPLLLAFERGGITAPRTAIWYVGDKDTDILCAKAAGCVAVFIENDTEQAHVKRAFSPELSFKNCREFGDFLLQYPSSVLQQSCDEPSPRAL